MFALKRKSTNTTSIHIRGAQTTFPDGINFAIASVSPPIGLYSDTTEEATLKHFMQVTAGSVIWFQAVSFFSQFSALKAGTKNSLTTQVDLTLKHQNTSSVTKAWTPMATFLP